MNTLRSRVVLALLLAALTLPAVGADIRRNAVGMEFVFVPPGEFRMGTGEKDIDDILFEMDVPNADLFSDEMPVHSVQITRGYWLGRTEVTQEQWEQVMKTRPGPDDHWQRRDWKTLPVVSVSWNMAQKFVAELSKRDLRYNYRLPTEAEWEYAARAGSNRTRPMPAEQLDDYAWILRNSGDVPHPVATRKPNAFGLYDMLGNAWEWVNDRYSDKTYTNERRVDPTGPAEGLKRLRRGGSYHCPVHETRPGFRSPDATADVLYTVTGFRVVAEEKKAM